MSCLRLYAFPLVLILWALTIELTFGNPEWVVITRLITSAIAAAISLRESARNNNERKQRNGG